ncbi:MAG: hypothetical protein JEZ03_01710 [Bacteroidales bacterium]|nr:hypothetical protein [Bacteroidales bacterium]
MFYLKIIRLAVLVCFAFLFQTTNAQYNPKDSIPNPFTLRLSVDPMIMNISANYRISHRMYSELGWRSAGIDRNRIFSQLKYAISSPDDLFYVKLGAMYSYGQYYNIFSPVYEDFFHILSLGFSSTEYTTSRTYHAISPVMDLQIGPFFISYSHEVFSYDDGPVWEKEEKVTLGQLRVGIEFDPAVAYHGFVKYVKSF